MASAISSRRALLDERTQGRVAGAKRLVFVSCIALFAAAFGATKLSHPSHTKHRLQRLEAPTSFTQQLQDDALRGGVIAPPEAPPEAQTAAS